MTTQWETLSCREPLLVDPAAAAHQVLRKLSLFVVVGRLTQNGRDVDDNGTTALGFTSPCCSLAVRGERTNAEAPLSAAVTNAALVA